MITEKDISPAYFVKHLPDPAYAIDLEGYITAWNQAMEDLTGVPEEQVVGAGNFEAGFILYKQRKPDLIDLIRDCDVSGELVYSSIRRHGQSLEAETKTTNLRNKRLHHLLVQASPICDNSGNLLGAFETVRDITPGKQSENINVLLYRIASELNNEESLTDFFTFLHLTITEYIFSTVFMVALKNNDSDKPEFNYLADENLQPLSAKTNTVNYLQLCEQVLSSGRPLLINDPNDSHEQKDNGSGAETGLWLGVPLKTGGRVIGVMAMHSADTNCRYDIHDIDLLSAISEQTASSIMRRKTEEALFKSEERYRSIFENAIECVFQVAGDGRIQVVNPAMASFMGYDSAEQLIAERPFAADCFIKKSEYLRLVRQLRKNGSVTGFHASAWNRLELEKWAVINARIIKGSNGEPDYISGFAFDATPQIVAQRNVHNHKSRFMQLFDRSPQAIVLLDTHGGVLDTNRSFQNLFGYSTSEMRHLCSNLSCEEPPLVINKFEKVLHGETLHYEALRKDKNGLTIPVSILGFPFMCSNEISGAFFIYTDISPEKEFERQLSHQSQHDGLTGLPNRSLFMERLEIALDRTHKDESYTFAVLMLDLDMFKRINDSLGHHAGDELLVKTGQRIKKCLRSIDTLARMGSDEFAILIEGFNSPQQVIRIIKEIRNEIRRPILIEENEVFVSSSIGIVFKTAEYTNPDHILRDADISMYRAKQLGTNRFKVFNKAMHEHALKTLLIENEIRQGLPREQFIPYLQPVYKLSNATLAGFEALMRWNHPDRGLVGPVGIIPIAEETGLIVHLDRTMLKKSCQFMSLLLERYSKSSNLFLNVNLSPRHLSQPDLIEAIEEVLEETGFPAEMLKLEITESAIMESNLTTETNLEKIRLMGIRLAVDDFGTGYSSLSQLQKFPASTLKVDRSFVDGMVEDTEALEIVKAVNALGHSLGMDIVAEGVENRKQLELLRDMGCEYVQGFYFDKPVNVDDAEKIVKLMDQGFRHPGLITN
ncbi:EAL domain-containing protein [Maridesulfovibrio bastinii]|uniref:EAL domain-containing protein n=1 Tax=Maridesulfovibrio bastinii TaxID=47157 RepID=UPI00146F9D97|nr:EAL domain-containing protein [Maridesulfovibrio bastinii]